MSETEIIAWRIKLKNGFGVIEHTGLIAFVKVYEAFEKRPINVVNGSNKTH